MGVLCLVDTTNGLDTECERGCARLFKGDIMSNNVGGCDGIFKGVGVK